ncbi:hypothetical protein LOD99_1413 [Oopsacas minuta]|uniref:NAD(P)-binding protein n=1 Tax=Oopsacas minuta TaxID=111878 RepID=A0AAV7K798_9METZ|nr:hypothetical protein LOD99_1413 [Oopsacas minuta]
MASILPGKKIALVTGGGSGIGRTTAVKFSINGYNVIVADIDKKSADQTVELLKTEGLAVEVDVTIESQVEAMVKAGVDRFGRIDACYNNAGIASPRTRVPNVKSEDFSRVMDVNVKGVFLCMKYEIQQFLQQEPLEIELDNSVVDPNVSEALLAKSAPKPVRGYIVNMSSILGEIPLPGSSPYVASKWAVIGLSKTAASEYANDGILINCICPSFSASILVDKLSENMKEKLIARTSSGRFGTQAEIAETVLWLCSEDSTSDWAGRGIGQTTAIKFSANGYNVIVADIDKKSADQTVALLKTEGLAVEVDVTNESQVEAMVKAGVDRFGRIDACFNNAGILSPTCKLPNVKSEDFSKVMDVNVKGVFLCMRYEIKQFLQQEPLEIELDNSVVDPNVSEALLAKSAPKPVRGYIVNMSSILGKIPVPEFSPYVASKWAVTGLTKTTASKFANDGILINCICPSIIATLLIEKMSESIQDKLLERYSSGRFGTQAEIAEVFSGCVLFTSECCITDFGKIVPNILFCF